jgi:hypothetical protein
VVTVAADSLCEPVLSPPLGELDSSFEPLVALDDSPAVLPEDSPLEALEDSVEAEPDDDSPVEAPEADSPAAVVEDPLLDAELVADFFAVVADLSAVPAFLPVLAVLLVLATCAEAVVAFALDESAGSWPEASWT